MSRIGKKPIEVPAGVIVSVDPGRVTVSGPKGELRQQVPARMQIAQEDGTVTVTRPGSTETITPAGTSMGLLPIRLTVHQT